MDLVISHSLSKPQLVRLNMIGLHIWKHKIFFSQFDTVLLFAFLFYRKYWKRQIGKHLLTLNLSHKNPLIPWQLLLNWGSEALDGRGTGLSKMPCCPRGIWRRPRTNVPSLVTASHRLHWAFLQSDMALYSDRFLVLIMWWGSYLGFFAINNTLLYAVITL